VSGTLVGIVIATQLLAPGPDLAGLRAKFDRIVKSAHAEVGLSLMHLESGVRISIHGDRRFPMASVPPDTIVAHKTGTTDVVSNDVGIITLPADSAIGGQFVLAVFLTNGRPPLMQQTIAQLAGAAFEHFTGKPLPKPQKPKPPPRKKTPKRRKG
jgi:beta-lactamase class A